MSEETFKYWLIGGSVFRWNDDLLQWLLIKNEDFLCFFPNLSLHVCMSTCATEKMHAYLWEDFPGRAHLVASWENDSFCDILLGLLTSQHQRLMQLSLLLPSCIIYQGLSACQAQKMAAPPPLRWWEEHRSHAQSDSCSAPTPPPLPPLTVSHTSDLHVIHFREVWLKEGWDSLRVQDSLWSPSTTVRRNTGSVLHHWFLQFLWRWSGEQHNVICFTLWASTTNRLHSQQVEPPQRPKTSTKTCGFPRRTWLWVPNIKTRAVSQNITAKII